MMTIENETFLLLSIHEVHANRIMDRLKKFELRKRLPKEKFHKVFLYQTKGEGLIGAFGVGEILKMTISELWDTVGEDATSKERFDAYFEGKVIGCAIEVKNPVRFRLSAASNVIQNCVSEFTAPQSFKVSRPGDDLHQYLCLKYLEETKKKSSRSKKSKPHSDLNL